MKQVYIVFMDTSVDFDHDTDILIATTSFDKALQRFKDEVEIVRKRAIQAGYVIEESVEGLTFESYEDGYQSENHCNVSLIKQDIVAEDPTAGERLKDALESLKVIPESSYIPYASPAPSSTEAGIKKELNRAIECLENALFLHRKLYGKK